MSPSAATSPVVGVTITPASVLLQPGTAQQFTATVSGSSNIAVIWAATGGVITSTGMYTAPNNTGSYTVTATSVADTTKSASAAVTVNAAAIAVTISPKSASLVTGETQQFTATVTGTSDPGVNWSATGGSISSTGFYTAPSSAGMYAVTATSTADPTKSATATVSVSASTAVSIAISPESASLALSGTQQFTATVSGASNSAVSWSTTGGTVSSSGLYMAPSTAGVYTVIATSVADSSQSASAHVAVGASFFDDFTGTALDTTTWIAMDRPGDPSNNELQCYLPANQSVGGGYLNLTAKAQTVVCSDGATYNYTSAMVQWKSFNFTYGTVEVRAKMAGGQGTWPAIWLLGYNCQQSNVTDPNACPWPQPGSDEIDISEIKGGVLTTVWQNVISGSSGWQTCQPTTSDVSQNWHVYRLEWSAGLLVWKIDGATTCMFTQSIPSTPMFLLLNVALGGGGGTVDNSTLPQTMQVDYVSVFPVTP
jgi:beta-glucanase (GH16 family)